MEWRDESRPCERVDGDPSERARIKALARVEAALRQLRYGRVVVTVQDGRPMIVEVVEQEKIA
ncbi:hypothetical protein Tmar_0033 [Thermaerobacter marianensis DSM 12885]|uniref:DUF2292 domain-containing protein n=1 Tax=Thermaerobacter marianensis (strain ATCC 700841 / DSM 12885 / JCM 10246 / 7p75a) TaxID=644966 RepID=E6SKH1_THEM7|nr:hypothetical protein Tmar_0033 [Thermaerobacter marianensis DSM 12885]